ncbi:MAG: tetratricopeptide repeat protein [Alphaproteobacteria bacterium]|nr:tetratricopeptide repeat protein [Alphaproteobacteria bacterium]
MDVLEKQADRLYDDKKYQEALDIYLSLAKKYPKTEKYSIYCGNCFDAIGDTSEAIRYYKKASKLNPVSTVSLLALANLYYNNEDYENAVKFAHMIVKKFPDNASAKLILGNVAYCQRQYEKAFEYYNEVYAQNKKSYIALINMANTCYDLARYVRAVDYATSALKLNPASVDAYIILGNSYLELNKTEKAELNLLKALDFKSDNPWIYNSLSRLYQKSEQWEDALNFGWKSVLFAGDAQEAQHINFGYLLYECVDEKGPDVAVSYAKKWQEAYPKNKLVQYMAAAVLEDKKTKQADTEYVKKIFDAFAEDFDETLIGLEYQVPQLIAEAVVKYFKKDFWKKTKYLDLGCGTGLCGQMLKPVLGYHTATGVDLSAKMLEKARAKGVYDRLENKEIIEFVTQDTGQYNLVTAGDVLTYFGDLKKLFEGVAKVLNLGGMFVFSISENMFNDADYSITPSGRFVHKLDYIMALLKKNGYGKVAQDRKALRNEGDKVVYGYIIVAEKSMIIEK